MLELYRVPKPDENTDEITLAHWYAGEGASFKKDDPICQMIAQKGDFDYLALHDAVLLKQLVSPGSVVPIDYIFAIVGDAGAELPDVSAENRRILDAHGRNLKGASDDASIRATPAARRLAREKGVKLSDVSSALNLEGPVRPGDVETYIRMKNGGKS
jgi:pyruvate/2-oxoglutarate dehydrogenase complex dihydrolipoamide acyltransferase (E2) component